MTNEDEERKQELQVKRRLGLIGHRFLLTGPVLCNYSPGDAFWGFVLPGNEQDFDSDSFEANYMGDVPSHFADKIDRILIDWLTQQASVSDSIAMMTETITELNKLRPHQAGASDPDAEIDLLPRLVESLTSLRDTILPDDEKRAALAALISAFRDTYHNVGYGKGNRPLGRG